MILEKVLLTYGVQPDKLMDVFMVVDKIDKLERHDITQQLNVKANMTDEVVDTIYNLIKVRSIKELGNFLDIDSKIYQETQDLFCLCDKLGLSEWIQLDLSIVRGLSYYTGFVFEGFCKNSTLRRALCGGGTYNNMMTEFGYTGQISACGFGLGDCVVQEVLTELNRMPKLG